MVLNIRIDYEFRLKCYLMYMQVHLLHAILDAWLTLLYCYY